MDVVEDVTTHLSGHKSLWFGYKSGIQPARIFINASLLDSRHKIEVFEKRKSWYMGNLKE